MSNVYGVVHDVDGVLVNDSAKANAARVFYVSVALYHVNAHLTCKYASATFVAAQ